MARGSLALISSKISLRSHARSLQCEDCLRLPHQTSAVLDRVHQLSFRVS